LLCSSIASSRKPAFANCLAADHCCGGGVFGLHQRAPASIHARRSSVCVTSASSLPNSVPQQGQINVLRWRQDQSGVTADGAGVRHFASFSRQISASVFERRGRRMKYVRISAVVRDHAELLRGGL